MVYPKLHSKIQKEMERIKSPCMATCKARLKKLVDIKHAEGKQQMKQNLSYRLKGMHKFLKERQELFTNMKQKIKGEKSYEI